MGLIATMMYDASFVDALESASENVLKQLGTKGRFWIRFMVGTVSRTPPIAFVRTANIEINKWTTQ